MLQRFEIHSALELSHTVFIGYFRVQNPSLSKWGQGENLCCENEFYLHENENHFDFHIKCWAVNLVLIQRPAGTRKWPIMLPPHSIASSQGCSLATSILGDCNTLKEQRWRLRRQQTCNAFNEQKRTSSSAEHTFGTFLCCYFTIITTTWTFLTSRLMQHVKQDNYFFLLCAKNGFYLMRQRKCKNCDEACNTEMIHL